MKIVALAGGVGGAKLVDGLVQLLRPEELTIIVNTGDDFEHLGLYISPDVDAVCYMLAGISNPETGWGRADDTFSAMENIELLGGPNWFKLGDKDLATHIERTIRLRDGDKLSKITHDFCKAWGVAHTVQPMSDDPVRTMVTTIEYGELPFQEYFVLHQTKPSVKSFRFAGIDAAQPAPGVNEAILKADGIVICPSNPWVSIDPILALTHLNSLNKHTPPVVAVSPIIAGKTIKGPAAKMFSEMGIIPSAVSVSEHYKSLLSGFILDTHDKDLEPEIRKHNIRPISTNTIMKSRDDRCRLAQDVLNLFNNL